MVVKVYGENQYGEIHVSVHDSSWKAKFIVMEFSVEYCYIIISIKFGDETDCMSDCWVIETYW